MQSQDKNYALIFDRLHSLVLCLTLGAFNTLKKKKNSLTIFKRGCGALKNLVLAHCLSICPYLILWRCKCFYFSCSNCMSFTRISWCYMCAVLRCSVVSNSLWPHGLLPTRLLCPWNFPGKNTGVGCHFLLQGIFLTQGSNPHLLCLLHWQVDILYHWATLEALLSSRV